jgi:hypothetical protein
MSSAGCIQGELINAGTRTPRREKSQVPFTPFEASAKVILSEETEISFKGGETWSAKPPWSSKLRIKRLGNCLVGAVE